MDRINKEIFMYGFAPKGIKINLDKLEDIRVFIRENFYKRMHFNTDRTSYGLKHIVERSIGRYVSNGELIAAMILEGFKCKRAVDTPNAFFNIAENGMKDLYLKSVIESKY